MYTKLGFFHFGQPCGDAIKALETELRKYSTEETAGALIVLPEYLKVDENRRPLPDFPSRLQEICTRFRVSFVVALV
jgi:hypothetical protein